MGRVRLRVRDIDYADVKPPSLIIPQSPEKGPASPVKKANSGMKLKGPNKTESLPAAS